MNLIRSSHGTDVLELSDGDITNLKQGISIQASGLLVRKRAPDVVKYYGRNKSSGALYEVFPDDPAAELNIVYNGGSGDMMTSTILK